ncbi:MAG TPA: phage holin family protein [Ohtaekwangia sp.]
MKLFKLDGLVSNVTGYVEARIELMKLEIQEDVAKTLGKAIVFVFLAFALTLFIMLISIGVAIKIGESLGKFSGFSIVAGIYLVLALVLFLFRDSISGSFEKQLIGILKKKKEKENN